MGFESKIPVSSYRFSRQEGGLAELTLTGAYTLSPKDGQVLLIDAGGASRDVTLSIDYQQDGMCVEITNASDAAEDLVIKDPAASTIVTISQNEKAKVGYTGTAFVHFGIVTIALS